MVVVVDSLSEGGTWCMHGVVMGIIFKLDHCIYQSGRTCGAVIPQGYATCAILIHEGP